MQETQSRPIPEQDKQEFLNICTGSISRPGIAELIAWLESSDFFYAPASTRYHNSFAGGLLRHSLNVYHALKDLNEFYHAGISEESVAIISLFHDLCKVNMYKQDTRNVKVNGVWTAQPCYSIEEKFAYGGHGSKSVFITERFIRLTPEEAAAINSHMGAWDGDKYVSNVYERNISAFLLHMADEVATFITETKEEKE